MLRGEITLRNGERDRREGKTSRLTTENFTVSKKCRRKKGGAHLEEERDLYSRRKESATPRTHRMRPQNP